MMKKLFTLLTLMITAVSFSQETALYSIYDPVTYDVITVQTYVIGQQPANSVMGMKPETWCYAKYDPTTQKLYNPMNHVDNAICLTERDFNNANPNNMQIQNPHIDWFLTSAELNSYYPQVEKAFCVYCWNIGETGLIYVKMSDTEWRIIPMGKIQND